MIRTLLFGMTGFGNSAFRVLSESPLVELVGVFAPARPEGPFPYYDCMQLHDVVASTSIPLFEGVRFRGEPSHHMVRDLRPDLIVVASFNQIIPRPIISLPRLGVINIHPSLLPRYRGATPTVWVLLNGERETGVTAHFIEDERLDSGRIICQKSLTIHPSDTDGTLRRRLAELSERVIEEAIELILEKGPDEFPSQKEEDATSFPKRTEHDAEIDISRPIAEIQNRVRAMTPYPGACLKHEGRNFFVQKASLVGKDVVSGISARGVILNTADGLVEFQIAKESRCEH